jgi:hypothetical protein
MRNSHIYRNALTSLSDRAIRSAIRQLEDEDRLTLGLREALRYGADINDLSADTGLTCDEIRRRVNRNLNVLSELEMLVAA